MALSYKELLCLKDAKAEAPSGWRPWRGSYGCAKRLAKLGYLKKAGITAMPPHICYVLSDEGAQALSIAAALALTSTDRGGAA